MTMLSIFILKGEIEVGYVRRIAKKRMRKLLDEILGKGYFITCNYHPAQITEYGWNKWDHDVDGITLTNSGKCSCCLLNCAPTPITKEQAEEMVEVWETGGDRALAIKYGGYTEEQYTEFERLWR